MSESQSLNSFPVATQKPPLTEGTGWPSPAAAGSYRRAISSTGAARQSMLHVPCCSHMHHVDVLSWGGETQALIYNPKTKKVIAINALVCTTRSHCRVLSVEGDEIPPE